MLRGREREKRERARENTFQNTTGTFLPTHFTHTLIFPYFEPCNVHCVQHIYTDRTECAGKSNSWLWPQVVSECFQLSLPPTRKVADFSRSAEQWVYLVQYGDRPGHELMVVGTDLPTDHVVLTTFNPSKPSGHYMYHQFNIQQFYVLPTQCICVFCVYLRTNSDYFPIQH